MKSIKLLWIKAKGTSNPSIISNRNFSKSFSKKFQQRCSSPLTKADMVDLVHLITVLEEDNKRRYEGDSSYDLVSDDSMAHSNADSSSEKLDRHASFLTHENFSTTSYLPHECMSGMSTTSNENLVSKGKGYGFREITQEKRVLEALSSLDIHEQNALKRSKNWRTDPARGLQRLIMELKVATIPRVQNHLQRKNDLTFAEAEAIEHDLTVELEHWRKKNREEDLKIDDAIFVKINTALAQMAKSPAYNEHGTKGNFRMFPTVDNIHLDIIDDLIRSNTSDSDRRLEKFEDADDDLHYMDAEN